MSYKPLPHYTHTHTPTPTQPHPHPPTHTHRDTPNSSSWLTVSLRAALPSELRLGEQKRSDCPEIQGLQSISPLKCTKTRIKVINGGGTQMIPIKLILNKIQQKLMLIHLISLKHPETDDLFHEHWKPCHTFF